MNTHIEELNFSFRRKFVRVAMLLLVSFCVFSFPAHALPALKDKLDSTEVKPNVPDSKKDFNGDDYYKYDTKKNHEEESENVFDRIWNSFWEHLWDGLSGANPSNGFNPWTILWIVILIALIVLVVLKVTNSGASTVFGKKRKAVDTVDAKSEDVDIYAVDYDRAIADAISKRDYRFAVRLWFLRTLKSLSEKEYIHWKLDKTNSDYYYELSGKELQKEFGTMSYTYDYVWYGEFPIDEESYKTTEYEFRRFNDRISV
ncbi:MAG TPA: hypothetical protein VL651_01925 [Bacteroidia bacterium]|nr:hypothetical protein [Bacteroidia bacterium]